MAACTGEARVGQVKKGGEEVGMVVECISRRKRKEHMQRQGRSWLSLENYKYFEDRIVRGQNGQVI